MTEKRNIKNIYVSSDFLEDDLIRKKSDEFNVLINRNVKQNRSAFPVACFHSQSYNFSKSTDEKIPAIVMMIMVFALPVLAIKRRNMLMYFCASALAGFEIIILFTLQLIIGNMYQLTGLIIAGLMTGLAVGSGINISFLNSFSLRSKALFLMIFYIGFGLIFNYVIEIKSGLFAIATDRFFSFLTRIIHRTYFPGTYYQYKSNRDITCNLQCRSCRFCLWLYSYLWLCRTFIWNSVLNFFIIAIDICRNSFWYNK